MYISSLCHRKGKLFEFFFNARLTRMRRYIISPMLGIIWTEGWLGYGSVEVEQLPGLLGRQI